jgi:hypothetical protein
MCITEIDLKHELQNDGALVAHFWYAAAAAAAALN